MFKTEVQKKAAIIAGLIFLLISALLLFFKVVTFTVLWSIIVVLPILFMADICFATLPITIPLFLGMACYTLIKKEYEKLNSWYETILLMITTGIINSEIDGILNYKKYLDESNGLRLYWFLFLMIAFYYGIIYISRKKDTRLYLLTYGIIFLFYMLYKILESFE